MTNQEEELVCLSPFLSMPIYSWHDAGGNKNHDAYFDVYPNIWRHGDYIEINDRGGILFVKLLEGITLNDDLKNNINNSIRTIISQRHVLEKNNSGTDIPYTLNMKKVELADRKVVMGHAVENKDVLVNPEALDFNLNIEELK